jgi:hypothetical protein
VRPLRELRFAVDVAAVDEYLQPAMVATGTDGN